MTRDDTSAEVPRRSCPICRRPEANSFRPFCSKRCADIDLGRWLAEGYRIPSADDDNADGVDDEAAEDRDPSDATR
jgi:uncharacterized protein